MLINNYLVSYFNKKNIVIFFNWLIKLKKINDKKTVFFALSARVKSY